MPGFRRRLPCHRPGSRSCCESLAELYGHSLHYWASGFDERRDQDYQRLHYLEHKVALMLDSRNREEVRLREGIRQMIEALESGKEGDSVFHKTHTQLMQLSETVLRERLESLGEVGESRKVGESRGQATTF